MKRISFAINLEQFKEKLKRFISLKKKWGFNNITNNNSDNNNSNNRDDKVYIIRNNVTPTTTSPKKATAAATATKTATTTTTTTKSQRKSTFCWSFNWLVASFTYCKNVQSIISRNNHGKNNFLATQKTQLKYFLFVRTNDRFDSSRVKGKHTKMQKFKNYLTDNKQSISQVDTR